MLKAGLEGIVANMARKPTGGDTDQLRAVAAGQCDLAISNTYYYGRLLDSERAEDKKVVNTVKVFGLTRVIGSAREYFWCGYHKICAEL